MLIGLGHLDLVCCDLDASLAFYAAVFGPVGLEPPFLVPGERGEQIHYLRFPQAGSGSFGLRQALVVETKDEVDGVHARAAAAGAEILYAPKLWPQYHPEYYATFFLDPDGFRLEVAASRDSRL